MTTVRKTAVQRRAEAEAEAATARTALHAAFVQNYAVRFAAVLYFYASTDGFSVKKLGQDTYTFGCEESFRQSVHLRVTPPTAYDYRYMDEFDDVERDMVSYLAERAEMQRQYEARQAALAKVKGMLTTEELKLVGL